MHAFQLTGYKLQKILIANRGEIAVRIIRACRDLGIGSVAVYSECDQVARYVRMADEAYPIGPSPPTESYLHINRIIDVARRCRADAIHPGYGFLSENAAFAEACRDASIIFIGPSPELIERMGDKTAARQVAKKAGISVVPGTEGAIGPEVSDDAIAEMSQGVGFPLLVKAAAGGGGKGMREATSLETLASAIRTARSEAETAFGDSAVYLERKITEARHIEVQLLGDHYGTVLPFVERECSLQRRHQKVLEETPSTVLTEKLRAQITSAAAEIARSVGYTNAGTVEFLLTPDGQFYFLEMNTRLQVEHPITEAVTGVDLVQWQIRIARGERLTLEPKALLVPRGHAIECRITAEDPDNSFMPSPGHMTVLQVPSGPGIREDSNLESNAEISIYYDPLISKLVAWGEDRAQAIVRMRRALSEYQIVGVRTSVPFFLWMLNQSDFESVKFDTAYLDRLLLTRQGSAFLPPTTEDQEVASIAAALYMFLASDGGSKTISSDQKTRQQDRSSINWKTFARIEGVRN